jgi:uncharacterized lipoprotein YddW (UPF0748 family)
MALFLLVTALVGAVTAAAAPHLDGEIYLPFLRSERQELPPEQPGEFRGLWITRFEWAIGHDPSPDDIDRMVDNAASAGFNALLFQVRGTADAYYDSRVEPWAAALGGSLGTNPGWDPLARMITLAHARGLQVHAYINVYPLWTSGSVPPQTNPPHLYHKLLWSYGTEDGKLGGLQWNRDYEIPNEYYLRATPASFVVDEQLLAVAEDLVTRYDLDGLHLDHIRYGGPANSCDPVTEERIGGPCFTTVPAGHASFADWQRAQVNGTVYSLYQALYAPDEFGQTLAPPDFLYSAAVWPLYESGYHNFYQDPKAWLRDGYIDGIMPMLYGSFDDSVAIWRDLAAGFQADNAGRLVIPGIHGNFESFAEIAGRIEAARELGTAGHAIFAYSYLDSRGYFDDLAAGPYREPAVPPSLPARRP